MKRSLLICLSVLLALAGVAVTGLAMDSHSAQQPSPVGPAQDGNARVAIAHLAPFSTTTAVHIRIDGILFPQLANVEFGHSTSYIEVPTGTHSIEVYPVGSPTPALTATIDLEVQDYTAIAVGGTNTWPLALELLEDDNTPPLTGTSKIRMGHLAPFAPTITDTLADIRLQDGTPVGEGVPYGVVAPYEALPEGDYDLKITAPGGYPTLIDPMPASFGDGDILSVFAVGNGTNQPLGIFVLPSDAEGFFLDLAASVQVAHLAPFAPDPLTAVDVSIDATPVLTNFAFADSTGYLPLQADVDHLIEIFPAGSDMAAISATVNLTHPLAFTAIAVGGANGWPLGLELLQDDNAPPPTGLFKARIGHLAPFAATITDTLADVRLQDGTAVTESVPYGTIGTHTALPAGDYDLKITAPGGTPTLIDPFLVTFNPGDILSVFAVGDGANQPLGVFALPSGQPGALLPLAKYQWLPIVFKDGSP
jgi:hypothetical protein